MNHTLLKRLTALLVTISTAFVSVSAYATVGGGDIGVGDEPLMPEQAFPMNASITSADMMRVEWDIVDGYYMYRDKFKFDSHTDGVALGEGVFPKGKIKEDEFFGKVETYRGKISVDVPLIRTVNTQAFDITITSQGCADIGICYPPQKQKVSLTLPPLPESSTTNTIASDPQTESITQETGSSSFNPLGKLKQLGASLGLMSSEDEFLPPDEAFIFTADVKNANTLRAHWDIAEGYYLYRDKFEFTLKDANGIDIGTIPMPEGKEKVDESFGRMVVYFNNVDIMLPLARTQLDPAHITLVAKYQGCAEKGLCYPPIEKSMPLSLPQASKASLTSDIAPLLSGSDAGVLQSQTETETKRSFVGNLLFAFGIGLLLTFTPCVLPMIPILVGVIIGQSGEKPTKTRAGMLSVSYVMGTAVTYSLAGWLAGASGQQLQAYTQNAWGLGIVALILVLLALSMFGFYEIQMPSAIQSRLQMRSQNLKGGSMYGTFFLGLISALIVGACVTPLLMLVLGIAIQAADPVLGASMMFAMAMGMGVFLVMVGVGAGHVLPKAGAWMDIVKYVFGVLLIGVAIFLLTPLEYVPILLLWGIFLIVIGVYMGATQAVPENASKWRYMWKGLGTVLLIWGVLALLGGMQGNRDIMQPVTISTASMSGGTLAAGGQLTLKEPHDLFIHLKNTAQLDEQLAKAKASAKPVLLDYFATWCTDCRRMEKATFSNPQVQQILQKEFVALQVDVTDPNNDATEAIKKRYKVFGPPAMLFFDKNGNPRKDLNFYGFKSPDDFVRTLKNVN